MIDLRQEAERRVDYLIWKWWMGGILNSDVHPARNKELRAALADAIEDALAAGQETKSASVQSKAAAIRDRTLSEGDASLFS